MSIFRFRFTIFALALFTAFVAFGAGLPSGFFAETVSAASTCNGLAVSPGLLGTGGVDTLVGTTGDDVINGQGGDDIIIGNGGNDVICGEDGDDTITTLGGNDWIDGGSGADIIHAGGGDDTVYGSGGNDSIYGEGGNDTLYGDNNNDTIDGGSGNDTIYGGFNDDNLTGGDGDDVIYGQENDDRIDGGASSDYCDLGPGDSGDTPDNCETGPGSGSSSSAATSSSAASSSSTPTSSSSSAPACNPPVSILPQCFDTIDNDCDGLIDWPADPGCSSPADTTELTPPASSSSSSSSSSAVSSSSSSSTPASSSSSSSSSAVSSSSSSSAASSSSSSSVGSSSSASSAVSSSGGSTGNVAAETSGGGGGQGDGGNGAFRGHKLNEFLTSIDVVIARATGMLSFTPPAAFGGTEEATSMGNRPLTESQLPMFCSLQRMLEKSFNVSNDVKHLLATILSPVVRRDVWFIEQLFSDKTVCENINAALRTETTVVAVKAQPRQLQLAEDGYPVSSNDVWNKCVRGTATLSDMRSNKDRMQLTRHYSVPKTCGYYRTAGTNDWSFPDDAFLTLTINPPAPGSNAMPVVASAINGYVIVPAETAVAAK